MKTRKRIIVGISGASGVIIGIRTVEELLARGHAVHVVVTKAAWNVIKHEVGGKFSFPAKAAVYAEDDADSPLNSTSFAADAMVVAPCSMKSLSAIAHGYADNLLIRAADAALRARRRLVLVPRETPLSLAHIENMAAAFRGGAVILPPNASYYHFPKSVKEMTDFFVGKILDSLGMENNLYRRWSGR